MSPAFDDGIARSLQSVSDQELEGAVKADMRQSGLLGAFAFELRRAKAKKAKIGLVICGAGETSKRAFAAKKLLRIIRQIAWKGRNLGLAVEDLHACNFAGCRCPQDRGQFVAAAESRGAMRPGPPFAAAPPRDDHGSNGADDRPWWRQTRCDQFAAGTD